MRKVTIKENSDDDIILLSLFYILAQDLTYIQCVLYIMYIVMCVLYLLAQESEQLFTSSLQLLPFSLVHNPRLAAISYLPNLTPAGQV